MGGDRLVALVVEEAAPARIDEGARARALAFLSAGLPAAPRLSAPFRKSRPFSPSSSSGTGPAWSVCSLHPSSPETITQGTTFTVSVTIPKSGQTLSNIVSVVSSASTTTATGKTCPTGSP